MMSKYELHISAKTRFLNMLRMPLTMPLFEKILLACTLHSKNNFWLKIIPPHYLYKKNSLRTVTRRGFKVQLELSDMFDHSVYFSEHDPSFDTIIPEIKDGATIIDVGANIGYTALMFAIHSKNSKVFAFEPHPVTYQKAQKNIDLNPGFFIQLFNMGLGSKKDSLQLSEVNVTNSGMNRILPKEMAQGFKSTTVAVEKLDEMLKQKNITKLSNKKTQI